jgi:cyanophycinase
MSLPLTAHLPGSGTLALVGSGEYLPAMDAVDLHLLGRLDEPGRVVCLPTAAGAEGDERIQYWCDLGEQHFKNLDVEWVSSLKVIDRSSAMDEVMADRIRQANFVYLSGGKPHYLYMTLEGTPVFDAIRFVLEQGGVLAGCSAGAMIFGERIPGSPFPWSWENGFNYLTGSMILPHFDELPKTLLSAFIPFSGQLKIVGIEGNTALVCSNKACTVCGSGGVTVIHGNDKQRFVAESCS